MKPDVITSAGKCDKVMKMFQKLNVGDILLETRPLPIWPGAFFVSFLPHPGDLKRAPSISRKRFKRFGHVFARGACTELKPDVIASAGKCETIMKHI